MGILAHSERPPLNPRKSHKASASSPEFPILPMLPDVPEVPKELTEGIGTIREYRDAFIPLLIECLLCDLIVFNLERATWTLVGDDTKEIPLLPQYFLNFSELHNAYLSLASPL